MASAPELSHDARGRILIAPAETAGYASRVQEGLRRAGWHVDVLELVPHPFEYAGEPPKSRLLPIAQRLRSWGARHGAVANWLALLATLPWRLWFSLRRLPTYDAVLFMSGRTISGRIDSLVARRNGVKTIAVFLGSDSRPPYMGPTLMTDKGLTPRQLLSRTRSSHRRVAGVERSVDVIISSPASGQFLTRPFIDWFAIGMPGPSRRESLDPPPEDELRSGRGLDSVSPQAVRVLHAPSDREAKGTREILKALERLGPVVDVEVISGRPHLEVMDGLRRADLVVDELYSDSPLAGLSSEAAALGVPTVTFGYASDFLRPFLMRRNIPEAHYADPGRLEEQLHRAVVDTSWRKQVGADCRDFVRNEWSASSVAQRLERVITNDIPTDWWVEPMQVDYIWGAGTDAEHCLAAWTSLIHQGGREALFLPPTSPALRKITARVDAERFA